MGDGSGNQLINIMAQHQAFTHRHAGTEAGTASKCLWVAWIQSDHTQAGTYRNTRNQADRRRHLNAYQQCTLLLLPTRVCIISNFELITMRVLHNEVHRDRQAV